MKKSRMVLKCDPYGALMINRVNRILIVFHQKYASGSIYTGTASINCLRCLERMLQAFLVLSHFDTKDYSGFFVNFISIYYIYLYALLDEKLISRNLLPANMSQNCESRDLGLIR